jgi:hypothetical protein
MEHDRPICVFRLLITLLSNRNTPWGSEAYAASGAIE